MVKFFIIIQNANMATNGKCNYRLNPTAIDLALFPLCICSECVYVYPAAYYVHMQTVIKSLINQMLSTGILSDTLKFHQVMIHHCLKSIARIGFLSSSTIAKVLETSLV